MLHTETLPHQGIYAPLSQAMTDSESEEEIEIHNSTKHRLKQNHTQLHEHVEYKRQRSRKPPTTLALKEQKHQQQQVPKIHTQPKQQEQEQHQPEQQPAQYPVQLANGYTQQPSAYTANMQHTFRAVMLSDLGMHGSEFSNFNSEYDNADNVAILGSNGGNEADTIKKESMSTARRVCFILSLLLCICAVFGFVWLVPCNEGSACPAPIDRIKTHNWLNNYTKIELKGGVNVVSGLRAWENNLIFLYRGDAFFPEFRLNNHRRNGIISLISSSGAVAWYDEMIDEPIAIDCTLIDIDYDGRPDCLVTDEYGEIGAFNPVSGQWHWRYKERSVHKVDAYDFPIILPDLDGDDVLEILFVSSVTLEQRTKAYVQQKEHMPATKMASRNILRILSGRHGNPIGEGFRVHDCDALRKLQLENTQIVTFSCARNNTEAQRTKTLAELYALITNKSIVGQKLLPVTKISQHRHYGQRKDIDSQRNIYTLSGRELIVENRGKCPDNCNVTLLLSEQRNGKTHIIRNFTHNGMYGMVPAQWHFKHTKSKMSGFVMKFWKWHKSPSAPAPVATSAKTKSTSSAQQQQKQNNFKNVSNQTKHGNAIKDNFTKSNTKQQNRNQPKRDRHFHFNSDFVTFEHFMNKRDIYNAATVHNHTVSEKLNGANNKLPLENYKMQMITESVILIIFIGDDTRIENTSQSTIIQFCRNDGNELICQPDLNNQENSMLIADLDQDDSQELVSYMSTFVQANEEPNNWKLVTYVRLLRLQAELPAIYDVEKK